MAWVYFIQQGENGPIKIGHTRKLTNRFRVIQSHNPVDLFLRLKLQGGPEVEYALHIRFAGLRMAGEWFQPGPALLAFIQNPEGYEKAPESEPDTSIPLPSPPPETFSLAYGHNADITTKPAPKASLAEVSIELSARHSARGFRLRGKTFRFAILHRPDGTSTIYDALSGPPPKPLR